MVRKVVDYLISMLRWVLVILIALSAIVAIATGNKEDSFLVIALIMTWCISGLLQKGE